MDRAGAALAEAVVDLADSVEEEAADSAAVEAAVAGRHKKQSERNLYHG